MTAFEKVLKAREITRPKITDYVSELFTDFFELRGDGLKKEDKSIYGGIALFHGEPVTVIGHRKGHDAGENIECNFAMPGPEGYRKAMRLMAQAEKFKRPVITFVDTPGAYPGLEAEMFGQSQAISASLALMSRLKTPVITVVTGEGSSGGALAISVADRILMLENAVYSVLSPEGFASILWHESVRKAEAAEVMKLTAEDLLNFGVTDGIIREDDIFKNVDKAIYDALKELKKKSTNELLKERFDKYRKFDERFCGAVSRA